MDMEGRSWEEGKGERRREEEEKKKERGEGNYRETE